MDTQGGLFKLWNKHKAYVVAGPSSVLCALETPDGLSKLGYGAFLPVDDPEYDPSDVLRGTPTFTGDLFDPETGTKVIGDQAEIALIQTEVTIGRPEEGWKGKFMNLDGTVLRFAVGEVRQDRTLGVYRIPVKILKPTGSGRHIQRDGEAGV